MQTLAWVLLIAGALAGFRKQFSRLALALSQHVERGGAMTLGVGSLSLQLQELRELPTFAPQVPSTQEPEQALTDRDDGEQLPDPASPEAPAVWARLRRRRKDKTRNIHLAHVISPSQVPGQRFDIFTYLVTGSGGNLEEVERAQFFLGRYWGNRIFDVPNQGTRIGFATSAYGPALCVCRVIFRDGSETVLERFLDFEMASVFEEAT